MALVPPAPRGATILLRGVSKPPVLQDLDFDGVNDENDLVITNNGGTGNINIWRKIDSADFTIIASVAPTTTAYTDPPTGVLVIDGTYQYKLTQDGVTGDSNTLTATITGVGAPAGSPPSALTGTHDGTNSTDLDWTNNSGTGLNAIERKLNSFGEWAQIATVSSGTATYLDATAFPADFNSTYYYRVRNESVAGYSNEVQVYVPGELP